MRIKKTKSKRWHRRQIRQCVEADPTGCLERMRAASLLFGIEWACEVWYDAATKAAKAKELEAKD